MIFDRMDSKESAMFLLLNADANSALSLQQSHQEAVLTHFDRRENQQMGT